jgi:hypothetical protein
VGPRAGLYRCGKSRAHRNTIPGSSSEYPVAILTELSGPHLWGDIILFLQLPTLFIWVIIIPPIETSDKDQAWPKDVEQLLKTTRLMSL